MYKVNICPKGYLFYNQICLINGYFINGLHLKSNYLRSSLRSSSSILGGT